MSANNSISRGIIVGGWVIVILLASSIASIVQAQELQLQVTDVRLSDPFYLNRATIVSANLTNTGQDSLRILGIVVEMKWRPSNTGIVEPLTATLHPNQTMQVSITVPVPANVIPANIQYRLGVNTTLGVWYDIWRNGIVMDYWFTAYASLHNSIHDRLTGRHYESQQANAYAQQAVNLLNQADGKHLGTEEGYNLLLQASKLIDQADQADAQWYQWQQNAPIYMLEVIGFLGLILLFLALVRGRHKKKKTKHHSRIAT